MKMMFKLPFIISLLLISVNVLGTISTTMTSESPAVSSTGINPNSRISLNPGTKASSTFKSQRLNLTTSVSARTTLTFVMTPSPKTTLKSTVTSETAKSTITKTVTNGSTILNPKLSIHFLFYVIFLLLCMCSG